MCERDPNAASNANVTDYQCRRHQWHTIAHRYGEAVDPRYLGPCPFCALERAEAERDALRTRARTVVWTHRKAGRCSPVQRKGFVEQRRRAIDALAELVGDVSENAENGDTSA